MRWGRGWEMGDVEVGEVLGGGGCGGWGHNPELGEVGVSQAVA